MISEIHHKYESATIRVHNGIKWKSTIKSLSKLTAIGMEEFSERCRKKGITAQP